MIKIARLNPLLETIKDSPQRVNKMFIQKNAQKDKIKQILKLAKSNQVSFFYASKAKLDRIHPHHQGVVAYVTEKGFTSLQSILSSSQNPFLILLDEIKDPQNLGAIIRSAEGAGVDGIILPERRAVGLTEAVLNVSAGAWEYLKVAQVKNLARCMEELKKRGVWLVGCEERTSSRWYEFDYSLPVGLILGSEGKGLRPVVKKKCHKILSIPLLGHINSLNVAAAASIFMYEVVRQRKSWLK